MWLCVSRNVFKATSLSLSRRVEKQCTRNSPLRVWIPIKTVLAYNVLPGSSTLKGHILLGNFSILKLFSLLGSIIPWLFNFKVPAFKSNRITDFISNFNIQSNRILVCLGNFFDTTINGSFNGFSSWLKIAYLHFWQEFGDIVLDEMFSVVLCQNDFLRENQPQHWAFWFSDV